jgi:diacylglycerol O-acyltransferase / wax synthase
MSTRFSSADAAWLHMDRPTNLMVINSVMLFDEAVDWQRVKQITQERLVDVYPRFSERVRESRLPLQTPSWEPDPDFELEHHMHHLALPAPGDEAALQALVGDLMTMPLDRSRPLWHIYMVDGFGDGAAMITRMHHCIADGIALARVLLSLTDNAPDAGIGPADDRVASRSPLASVAGVAGAGVRNVGAAAYGLGLVRDRTASAAGRAGAAVIRQAAHVAATPSHAVGLAGAVARDGTTLVKLLLTPADAATALKGDPGISRRVAWTKPLSLAEVKRIAHAHDATVNDVLLAAVSGGLRHYLRKRGGPIGEIQALVPFNLRPLDQPVPRTLGNRFGLVLLPLPVGMSGSYRRLTEVSRRMDVIKNSRDAAVSGELLSVVGHAPEPVERRVIDLFSAKGTAVMTNVPGPREPVYFAGTRVRTVLFWAPTSGHIGMSVSIFSYQGQVTVGLMVDATLIPDPERIVIELEREVKALCKLGRVRRSRPPGRADRTLSRPRAGRP